MSSAILVVVNSRRDMILLHRGSTAPRFASMWCFPGGKREEDETLKDAAIRECEEETQIRFNPDEVYGPVAIDTAENIEVYVAFSNKQPVLSDEHDDFLFVGEASTLPENTGPITTRIFNTMLALMAWHWPTHDVLLPDAPGQFGAARKHDIHTGVDLYTSFNTSVYAVEDGEVIRVENFTGPNAEDPSPWWNDTQAVLVRGASGVVTYGEITSGLVVGDKVRHGQVLGHIKPVLKSFKGRPTCMLHLELMTSEATGTQWWKMGDARPAVLLDPTFPLMLHRPATFDLTKYDGKAYSHQAPHVASEWWAVWGGSPFRVSSDP